MPIVVLLAVLLSFEVFLRMAVAATKLCHHVCLLLFPKERRAASVYLQGARIHRAATSVLRLAMDVVENDSFIISMEQKKKPSCLPRGNPET